MGLLSYGGLERVQGPVGLLERVLDDGHVTHQDGGERVDVQRLPEVNLRQLVSLLSKGVYQHVHQPGYINFGPYLRISNSDGSKPFPITG